MRRRNEGICDCGTCKLCVLGKRADELIAMQISVIGEMQKVISKAEAEWFDEAMAEADRREGKTA